MAKLKGLGRGLDALLSTVEAADDRLTTLPVDRIRPGTATYLVYMHDAPGSGIKRAMLSTSTVARERIEGADAWVIEQEWEDESGTVHTARTVHSARDLATLAQTTTWKRPTGSFSTTVDPKRGQGRIEGTMSVRAQAM